MNIPLALLDFLGTPELMIVAVLAVLLFGERLPEVARSFGKQFMDFKKHVHGIQNEFRSVAMSATNLIDGAVPSDSAASAHQEPAETREEATAPKFVPPPVEPRDETMQK